MIRAKRTKKARGETRCGLCRGVIKIGQQIGLINSYGWVHCSCINEINSVFTS